MAEFVTDDLTLAAFLVARGRTQYQLRRSTVNHAEWAFADKDDVIGLVDDYHEGEALVDPKKFMRHLRSTRTQLYDFLGQTGQPAGTPIRRDGSSS